VRPLLTVREGDPARTKSEIIFLPVLRDFSSFNIRFYVLLAGARPRADGKCKISQC
jgi:hypothetical protein